MDFWDGADTAEKSPGSRIPIEIHSAAEAKHGQGRRDAITTSWDVIGEKEVMLGNGFVFSFFFLLFFLVGPAIMSSGWTHGIA